MRAPEFIRIHRRGQFFDRAVIRHALEIPGENRDRAVLDRSVNQVGGVHQKHARLRFHQQLRGLRRFDQRLRRGQLAHQNFQALNRRGLRLDHFFRALDGFADARLIEGLEHVVDGVHVEGLNRVIVVGGGEDDLG